MMLTTIILPDEGKMMDPALNYQRLPERHHRIVSLNRFYRDTKGRRSRPFLFYSFTYYN